MVSNAVLRLVFLCSFFQIIFVSCNEAMRLSVSASRLSPISSKLEDNIVSNEHALEELLTVRKFGFSLRGMLWKASFFIQEELKHCWNWVKSIKLHRKNRDQQSPAPVLNFTDTSNDSLPASSCTVIESMQTTNDSDHLPPIITPILSIVDVPTTPKYNVTVQGTQVPYNNAIQTIYWADTPITSKEHLILSEIRKRISSHVPSESSNDDSSRRWLTSECTDIDILRFIRAVKSPNVDNVYKLLTSHSEWRVSPSGADTIMGNATFIAGVESSALNQEIFWLGVSYTGCPTLAIRTQAHDGRNYNDDPNEFVR